MRGAAALALAVCTLGCGDASSPATPPPVTQAPTTATAQPYNMVLLSRVDLATMAEAPHAHHHEEPIQGLGDLSGAGNWGYTTADGRRFALTGTSVGLSVVEVTQPERPVNVALVHGPASQWREVRTWGPFAYVSTEATHGLDIVDLRAPDRPELVRTWDRSFRSAHTLCVDEARGLLFANGARDADRNSVGMRVLDLRRDATNPRDLGGFGEYYIHDCYVRGNYLFASAIYHGFLAVLDISDPARVREVTRFFTGGRFTHNSWVSSDGRHLFTTDERADRPMEAWDIADLLSPRKVSQYIARQGTIPHNVMVDGQRALLSHYTEGVHLLDVRDPARPRVLGFYDTYDGNLSGFAGDWGAYIFPASNLIVASDMQGGLFVVQYTGPD